MTAETLSTTDKVQVKVVNHTAQITINNPPANTWDLESLTGLKHVVEQLNALPEIMAIVIHGQGEKFFSAGADLNQFAEGNKTSASEVANRFGEASASVEGLTIRTAVFLFRTRTILRFFDLPACLWEALERAPSAIGWIRLKTIGTKRASRKHPTTSFRRAVTIFA